ncbi:hypothetical protein CEXT_438801 [Caerostris extrusa]|uniref:Uncharacterized protein n=1 Tax=Caerostris extrusa TaxID=172846 RepID=A0AAV4ME58_CAEEX|nr:hypothetical protein CEXT_438801 [Caerostris extrusa]
MTRLFILFLIAGCSSSCAISIRSPGSNPTQTIPEISHCSQISAVTTVSPTESCPHPPLPQHPPGAPHQSPETQVTAGSARHSSTEEAAAAGTPAATEERFRAFAGGYLLVLSSVGNLCS